MAQQLRSQIDPCPFLPKVEPRRLIERYDDTAETVEITVPRRSWIAAGKAILLCMQQEAQGLVSAKPGSLYTLQLPHSSEQTVGSYDGNANAANSISFPPVPNALQQSADDGAEQSSISIDANFMTTSPIDAPKADEDANDGVSGPPSATLDGQFGNGHSANLSDLQENVKQPRSIALPTRKRSSDEAEMNEANDAVRSRSKRLKARADPSTLKGESAEEWAKWYSAQLQIYAHADDLALASINAFMKKLELREVGSIASLRNYMLPLAPKTSSDDAVPADATAMRALRQLLDSWDLSKSRALLSGGGLQDPAKGSQTSGLTTLLEHSMK